MHQMTLGSIVVLVFASVTLAEAPTVKNATPLLPARVAAFSPDGKVLATALSRDITLFDAATGKKTGQLTGHTGDIYELVFSADGKLLASSSGWSDQTARVFDVATMKQIASLAPPGDPKTQGIYIRALGFGADGKTLITGGRALTIFSLPDGAVVKSTTVPGRENQFVLLPDRRTVVSIDNDSSKLTAWDCTTGASTPVKQTPESKPTMGGNLAIVGGKKLAVASFMSNAVFLFDATTMNFERKVSPPQHLQRVGATPDGRQLVYGSWETTGDNFVAIIDAASGKPRVKIGPFDKDTVFSMALVSPDGKTLAAVVNEGAKPAMLWHLGQ